MEWHDAEGWTEEILMYIMAWIEAIDRNKKDDTILEQMKQMSRSYQNQDYTE